ncbi:FAD-dependent monooxygenase [Microbacterium sp. SSM24]|uniref:FAD-dependent monooxygenase n=1 Tax=Microbacterium sp. SSM24 TaxID=2991714 RepID=UPI002226812C|nr:FAD-dependent monooxygenase [Microbacterium sp. SSM24]MCW3492678.1 FAD-dependent monooxygenase [Microbacterium sp. SSM24]
MTIRVACVGGGPGGLFFSTLLKRARPDIEVVLFERNQPTDAFGFGVVFSDRTLQKIDEADPVLHTALEREGVHWESISVRLRGESFTFAGNGMAAIHRRVLLRFLQEACADAGVEMRFGEEAPPLDELRSTFDVVVAADGANSRIREDLAAHLHSEIETADAKFIWFGTTHQFDGLTFLHRRGEHGNFAAHAYPIGQGLSTFIVETDESTWRGAELDGFDMSTPPGASDDVSQHYLRTLFADDIDGAPLVANNSRWGNFRTRRTAHWHRGNVALLGDAVHTAHFSVGSGTKMAMEDAVALAEAIAASPGDLDTAFTSYESERQPDVARIQSAAAPSLSWWEHFSFYYDALKPLDFAFHFFSRSIDIERVRRRDPRLADTVTDSWLREHGAPPLTSPLRAGAATLRGRGLLVRDHHGRKTVEDTAGSALTIGEDVLVVTAPQESHLAAAVPIEPGADAVLIVGGSALSRNLVSERARLKYGIPSIILDDDLDDAGAATLILSGRADAIARTEAADVVV